MLTEDRPLIKLENSKQPVKQAADQRWSAIALVAGTTVGAGILALPAMTHPAGFLPSTVMLMVVWVYALVAALLLAEVNVFCMRRSGQANMGLLGMVESTLGKPIANVAGGAYLFLHYALLVAYLSQGGDILSGGLAHLVGAAIPSWAGPTVFALIFGGLLYWGSDQLVAKFNSTFVGIVILTFMALLVLSSTQVDPGALVHQNWPAISPAISVMLVALFYHNVVPVVATQLEGDLGQIRQSIVVGSVIPLLMFLIWNAVILGSMGGLASLGAEVFDPLEILRNNADLPGLSIVVSVFSEFAIATSFIGFTYGLLDFLKDAFQVQEITSDNRLPFYSLVFLPALGLSTLNPNIFFTALDYAGAFSISVLGGILPAIMAWTLRYRSPWQTSPQTLVPGGRGTLIIMVVLAVAVIAIQIFTMVMA